MLNTRTIVATVVLLLVLALGSIPTRAQLLVTGRVEAAGGIPLAYANVQLLFYADSSLAAGAMAGEDGSFVLENLSSGDYLLYVSLIGYKPYFSERITLAGSGEWRVEPITLMEDTVELEELSVRARRTLYEQKADRIIINVGQSISLSGLTVLDVLARSPGVIVNEQAGSISMLGKDGVQVMINSKLSYMPGEALLQYLAGMSADNLESIELITSPPAELDAEGNAGFINLLLKDSPDGGTSGAASISGGYGEGELGNASLHLDHRHNRLRINGSYSFLWNGQLQYMRNYRRIRAPEEVLELPAEARRDRVGRNHTANVAVDYELDSRTTLGAVVGAYHNRFSMDAVTSLLVRSNGTPITRSSSTIDLVNRWRHVMGNAHLRHTFDPEKTLTVDLDYLRYHNRMPTDNLNTSTDIATGDVIERHLSSGKVTPLGIFAVKSDYHTDSFEKWEFQTGIKAAFSRFRNEPTFLAPVEEYRGLSNVNVRGTTRLRENLLAAYGTSTYQATESATVEVGLRYELAASNLDSEAEQGLIDRRSGHFFPSIIYTHRLSDDVQLGGSYTRRITRPAFNDLASFSRYDDPYVIVTGNMGLQPAILNSFKVHATYGEMLASLEYAWDDSTITRFQSHLLPRTNIQVMSPMNFPGTQTITAVVGRSIGVVSWWSMQNNLMLIWKEVDGFSNRMPVTMRQTSVRVTSTQNFSLPGNFSLEASGFYQSETLFGTMRYGALGRIDLGLQRAVPGGRGTLTLSADNLFNSAGWSWRMRSPDHRLYIDQFYDFTPPAVRLTYGLRFGGGATASERSTAADEESGRIQP